MFPERDGHSYRFDDFTLDPASRLLLRANQPVPLNPKAFELLAVLVANRGRVITKEELLEQVWPNQFVEEGNLTVHMSAVRKALGERKAEPRVWAQSDRDTDCGAVCSCQPYDSSERGARRP